MVALLRSLTTKYRFLKETTPTKLVSINKKRKSDAQLSNEKVMHKMRTENSDGILVLAQSFQRFNSK